MIAALALAAAAAQPASGFAPPLDRPLRIRTEQERAIGGTIRRFVAERRLVFRRAASGVVAELTLLALSTDATGPLADRFLAGAAGLKGRVLRFRLSAAGEVLGLEEEDAAWQAATAPFERMRRPRGSPDTRPAGTFAQAPPERRLAILAAPLASLIAARDAAAGPATVRVTIPSPAGALSGTRTARVDAGRLILTTRAGDPAAGVSVERTRTVDRATGLLIAEDETTRLAIAGEEQVTRATIAVLTGN